MKLRIQSINFDATTALEAYIAKKTSKLEKFFDEIVNVEVYLKVVKPETAANKEAEIKISIPGVDFFVRSNAKMLYPEMVYKIVQQFIISIELGSKTT